MKSLYVSFNVCTLLSQSSGVVERLYFMHIIYRFQMLLILNLLLIVEWAILMSFIFLPHVAMVLFVLNPVSNTNLATAKKVEFEFFFLF